MNNMLKLFIILLGATFLLNFAMNYMANNISDFENLPLPPKKITKFNSPYPLLKVNAQSKDTWILVDFSSGEFHKIDDPENNKQQLNKFDWDLGFQRTKIISNGGETNPKGSVGVINLGQQDFEAIEKIPETSFTFDKRSWGSINNQSLADWYVYRTRTHNVESKKNLYILKTSDGYIKMKIINYYCGRPESDCQTMMCTRDEAACLTIQYSHISSKKDKFPILSKKTTQASTVSH